VPPASMEDHFVDGLHPRWALTRVGGGQLDVTDSALRLALPGAVAGHYSDAQIDDYAGLAPSAFPWRPPLTLDVRARFSHAIHPTPPTHPDDSIPPQSLLLGTAGFGFWNYPLSLTAAVLRLPEAIWFFAASPPSDMALAPGVPGWGWKAQVVHAHRWGALASAGPTALTALWARVSGYQDAAAHWVQRFTGAHEARLAVDPREWTTYSIEWLPDHATFRVDGVVALLARTPPTRPLGFVAWIDNQYAVATPRGELRFGTIATEREWLELDYIRIRTRTD
jgi:hypothetical protein